MQVTIYDPYGSQIMEEFRPGAVQGLKLTREAPYGDMDASFSLPTTFGAWQVWARHFNQVELYDENAGLAWQGFIYSVGRNFTAKGVDLTVEAVGWVAKLGMLTTSTNLSGEKGSTYITDHVLGDGNISPWLSAGIVDTNDYTISATRDYSSYKTFREILDDINTFNGYDWQVRGKKLYYIPQEDSVSYITRSRFVRGRVTQDLGDFANVVPYSYKTTAGVLTYGSITDSASDYPITHKPIHCGDGLTAAEALNIATLRLNEVKTLRSSSPLTVSKIWDTNGSEVTLPQVQPGKVIRIEDLAVDSTTLSASYAPNDIDVFRIASCTYDVEAKTLSISPGKNASRLPMILARMGLKK